MTKVGPAARSAIRLAAGAAVAAILAGPSDPPSAGANVITGTRNFQIVSRLTGPQLTGHVGIGGTDLGHMVNHNGKTYFLFGDTFADEGPGGADWRQNVMAYTTDRTPANGITFDGWITRPDGKAKQVITPGSQPVTYIPTGAISVGDRIYAWYMHVSNWSGWTLSHAGLGYWREGDSQFTIVPGFQFPGSTNEGRTGGNFGMVAASKRSPLENVVDDHVYLWGTPGGREGGVKLARVPQNQITNLSAYRYFDGTVGGVPQWATSETAGDKIVPDGVGEMSVMYNEAVGAWTMMYVTGGANPNFHMRQADNPWGPWSEAVTVARHDQAAGGIYAPYMNPLYVENDGRTVYFTMSLWNPYDVYLAKVDLDIDLRTRWTGAAGNWNNTTWSHGNPNALRRTILDNGGTVRLDTVASARIFDAGTAAGRGGTLEIQSGGALTIPDGGFRLGEARGGHGTLNMTGGAVAVTGGFNMFLVGDHGHGTATLTGGSVSARTFGVALQPTSTGHLNVGGDAVITTTGDRFVLAMIRNTATGERPTASMTMTGGTVNVNAGASGLPDAVIGFDGVASLDMSGGTFNVAGLFVSAVAAASGQAARSEATIKQSGGAINTRWMALAENGFTDYALSGTAQVNVRERMTVGWRAPSEAVVKQTGGAVRVDTAAAAAGGVGLLVADAGKGTYTISGGTLDVPRHMWVADQASAVGRVNVHGGTVNVGQDLALAMRGNAQLIQTAGALNVGGSLHIGNGDFATSVAAHSHAGGALSIGGAFNVGRQNGRAASTISGGTVLAEQGVRVGANGILNYTGGSIQTPSLRVDAGGRMNFGAGGGRTLVVDHLDVDAAGGGVIDLADNRLLVTGGDPGSWTGSTYTGITGLVRSGHNGGAWDGGGIVTTTPDASAGFTSLGIATAEQAGHAGVVVSGVSVSAEDVLVMYTYAGDANLDGFISGDDYSVIDFNIAMPGASGWYNGDFNYDGIVSGDDYSVIDFNIFAQGAPFPTGDVAAASAATAVPEPTFALPALWAALMRRRRRS